MFMNQQTDITTGQRFPHFLDFDFVFRLVEHVFRRSIIVAVLFELI